MHFFKSNTYQTFSIMKHRIIPLSLPLEKNTQQVMDKIFPSNLPSPNLYRIVAKHKDLFSELVETKFIGSTGLFDRRRLGPSLREKIILRTCFATENSYEFALHVETISLKMGLTKEQIQDIAQASCKPELWHAKDLVLFKLIDQLILTRKVEDQVAQEILHHFSEQDTIEIIHIIGLYTGVAMLVAFAQPAFDNYKQYSK